MPALNERATGALDAAEAKRLADELPGIRETGSEGGSLVVDARSIQLPPEALDAVLDMLQRLADGHAVVVASTDALLTTSQAAELLGISATYLLRLANTGVIAVEYRGTHRRFRLAETMRYLEQSKRAAAERAAQKVTSEPKRSAPSSSPPSPAAE